MRNRITATSGTMLAALLLLPVGAPAQQTQTIRPGMTTEEVQGVFGAPAAMSYRGAFTYYFYDNGCERTCGFLDLVIFQHGQVVDAVLRARWREYAGESSSPKGTVPVATPGGTRLQVPAAVEGVQVRPAPTVPTPIPADTLRSDTTRAGG